MEVGRPCVTVEKRSSKRLDASALAPSRMTGGFVNKVVQHAAPLRG